MGLLKEFLAPSWHSCNLYDKVLYGSKPNVHTSHSYGNMVCSLHLLVGQIGYLLSHSTNSIHRGLGDQQYWGPQVYAQVGKHNYPAYQHELIVWVENCPKHQVGHQPKKSHLKRARNLALAGQKCMKSKTANEEPGHAANAENTEIAQQVGIDSL